VLRPAQRFELAAPCGQLPLRARGKAGGGCGLELERLQPPVAVTPQAQRRAMPAQVILRGVVIDAGDIALASRAGAAGQPPKLARGRFRQAELDLLFDLHAGPWECLG